MSSDSEDDPEYVPTGPQNDGSSSSDSDPDNERTAKRIRTSPPKLTMEEAEAREKIEQDRTWQKFKSTSAERPQRASVTPKSVKVQKRYRFAGEDVLEIVEVPEDSEDAKKWPPLSESGPSSRDAVNAVDPSSSSSADLAGLTNATAENSKSKPRGTRKSKIVLPSLPTTSSGHKAKKLTTLDKSSMDWKAHISSDGAGAKDELEANRRSGGYLGRVEFLQRVSERKVGILEENKTKKRRR